MQALGAADTVVQADVTDPAQALVYAFAQSANVLVEEILLRPVLQVAL